MAQKPDRSTVYLIWKYDIIPAIPHIKAKDIEQQFKPLELPKNIYFFGNTDEDAASEGQKLKDILLEFQVWFEEAWKAEGGSADKNDPRFTPYDTSNPCNPIIIGLEDSRGGDQPTEADIAAEQQRIRLQPLRFALNEDQPKDSEGRFAMIPLQSDLFTRQMHNDGYNTITETEQHEVLGNNEPRNDIKIFQTFQESPPKQINANGTTWPPMLVPPVTLSAKIWKPSKTTLPFNGDNWAPPAPRN